MNRLLATILLLASSLAWAEEPLWLSVTWRSYHADRAAGYNERNTGLGAEYHFNRDWSLAVGEYRNSFNHKSKYYGVAYTPFTRGEWKAGLLMLDVSGYDPKNLNRYIPVAVPMIAWEHGYFGVNTIFIPPVGNGTGVLGMQLKVSVW